MDATTVSIKAKATAAGIFLDFDGTLSEIAEMPGDARPIQGVPELLRDLADRYCVVTIVSGRSARQLVEWLGSDIDIWGVHGAERSTPGSRDVVLSPTAAPFAELMQKVRAEAEASVGALGMPGVIVEDKGVMVVLHFRATSDRAAASAALQDIADDLIERHGLWPGHGRLALELKPPVELSKGQVVEHVARERQLTAAVFCGDDVVDLPGFSALDALERQGGEVLRVAVDSEEAPRELIDRADILVDGPSGALRFLRTLL